MINQDRLVNRFMEFVSIDSESKNELKFGQRILEELHDLGLEAEMDNAGAAYGSNSGNVIGWLKGNCQGQPVLFSFHLDTVTPGVGIKPVVRDGVIYSDGTTILGGDDKAGIAAFIEAIQTIKEHNLHHVDIEVVFSILEESGLNGSKSMDMNRLKAKKFFILDEGDVGRIIIQGPAQDKLQVKIIGKASHAGVAPEEGISAISVAANAISQMNLLRIDSETTANIGSIHGGIATNIVSPEVIITAEARSLNDDKLTAQTDHMVACFEKASKEAGARCIITRERMYSAFKVDPRDEIVTKTIQAVQKIGLTPVVAKTGGGSDANIYNARGVKAINLGIGENKAHTLEEFVKISDLVNVARLVISVIQEFSD